MNPKLINAKTNKESIEDRVKRLEQVQLELIEYLFFKVPYEIAEEEKERIHKIMEDFYNNIAG